MTELEACSKFAAALIGRLDNPLFVERGKRLSLIVIAEVMAGLLHDTQIAAEAAKESEEETCRTT